MFAAFAAIYLFWGATFLGIRYAVLEVPPLPLIALRCAGGAVVLYGWLAWRGTRQPVSVAAWRTAFAAGAILFFGGHGVLAWAEQHVTSADAALLMTSIPLWMVSLDSWRQRRAPGWRAVLSMALGVAGVVALTGVSELLSGDALPRVALLGASFAWALGSIVARDGARPDSVAQSIAMQLAAGAVVLTLSSVAVGELHDWSITAVSWRGAASLAFLILCGTVAGFGAYTWLMREASPAAVGTYAFVNPIVALGLAWLVGDGQLTMKTALSAALVVGAVVVTWQQAKHGPGGPSRAGAGGAASHSHLRGACMIARIWRGTTAAADAGAYLDYLEATGLSDYRKAAGNRGVLTLRRVAGDRAEFVLVSMWDSYDAIRAFAGPDIERAVFYPDDERFLIERGEHVDHFEISGWGWP